MSQQDPAKEGTPPPQPTPPPGAEAMAERALSSAQQAVSNLQQNVAGSAPAAPAAPAASASPTPANARVSAASSAASAPFEPPAFDRAPKEAPPKGIDLLADVNLNVKIELGRTRMLVEDVLKLTEGAVVELDKLAGDPVDVYVNERHVAKGEVLVLNDNFCVRINEIVAEATGAETNAGR